MKINVVAMATAIFAGTVFSSPALTTSWTGISTTNSIYLPLGYSVLEAVDVAGSSTTVNGITFLADPNGGAANTSVSSYNGTDYTAGYVSPEGSSGISGAPFTQSTVNLVSAGFVDSSPIALNANSNYILQVYFSDNNAGRSAELTYNINGAPVTVGLTQNQGVVNLFQLNFNAGASPSTFSFQAASDATHESSKLAGFDILEAVPEPTPLALAVIGGVSLLLVRRHRA